MKQLQSTESSPSPIPKQFKIKIWLSDTAKILSKKKKKKKMLPFVTLTIFWNAKQVYCLD